MKANDSHRNAIYLEHSDLPEGQTESGVVCPACQGGDTHEKSLSVTRRGNTLLFICHRSSCDLRGAVTGSGMPATGAGKRRLDNENSYPRITTEPLNQASIKFLATRYGIPEESIEYAGFRWTGDASGRYGRRVSMPIYGPNLVERGTSYRSYEGVRPKAIVEMRTDADICSSWYRWLRKSDTLVLVEDQVSAIKLAPHVHSVALLGTNISEELANEIAAFKYKHVLIMLDNDATFKAIKLQIAWRSTIKGLLVAGLEKDIKDMTNEEFSTLLHDSVLPTAEPLPSDPNDRPF